MIDSKAPLNFKDVGLWVTCRLIGSINHIMCLNWAVYILAQNFIPSCLLLCLKCVRAVLCKMIISQWVDLLHSPSLETWADSWPPRTHGVHIPHLQSLVGHPVPTSSTWVGHRRPGGGPCWRCGDMSVPCGSACASMAWTCDCFLWVRSPRHLIY